MLDAYFQELFAIHQTGIGREESYYSALKSLLEAVCAAMGKRADVIVLPKKTEAGNPDFLIRTPKGEIIGLLEAKSFETEHLDPIETSDQLKRYRKAFPNLLLTNFFEFRLYRDGDLVDTVQIGRPFVMRKLKSVPPIENAEKFEKLLHRFLDYSFPEIKTAKQLAVSLAHKTQYLRDQILAELETEGAQEGRQMLESFFDSFQKNLISSLTIQQFSDLFAQTVTYGLFSSRSRSDKSFTYKQAFDLIPPTIGILRSVFRFISSVDHSQQMYVIIAEIAQVLAVSDIDRIIESFHKEGKGRDPIVHFYETFLAEYDPHLRKSRGVYYTPEPVVHFITRSVHILLKEKFAKPDGFATPGVTVLDPASGTLTFPAEAIRLSVDEYKGKYGDGDLKNFIESHILQDFYAFELMMAPYAVGHLKIGFVLHELGYEFARKKKNERFHLYLTNTLEMKQPVTLPGPLEQALAEETKEALKVKERIPIMVVIGNPPYSGISYNTDKWILEQIETYKTVDGKPLGERNPKWLQDDYVKFFRFARWKIEQTGAGVLGFITNHAWLDNPTFRGMRASLLNTFDELYILNLHGSTLKKEKTPEGGKDENVFDIQPGVAIAILVKLSKSIKKKVFYSDEWGLREEKYNYLESHDIGSVKWKAIEPKSPEYYFVSRNEKGFQAYKQFWKVTDVFPLNSVGIVTGRDEFVIDDNRQALEARIRVFRESKDSDSFIKESFGLKDKPASRWAVSKSRKALQDDKDWERRFTRILYRPFDEKWLFYHPALIERSRSEVMQHMMKPNFALLTHKREELNIPYSHFLVSEGISEHGCLSGKTTNYHFPLYRYLDEPKQQDIFSGQKKLDLKGVQRPLKGESDREPNIAQKVFDELQKTYGKQPSPEDIFQYIYAVLYSNTYRKKYHEFLKTDFPRVPFAKDYKLFQKLAKLGSALVELHLLKSPDLAVPAVKFNGTGDNLVETLKYVEKEKRVYINEKQYFEPVEYDVWNYYIGGYQVLDKWLKDWKGKHLSSEGVKHFARVATVLGKTIEIQKDIDDLYPSVETDLVATGGTLF